MHKKKLIPKFQIPWGTFAKLPDMASSFNSSMASFNWSPPYGGSTVIEPMEKIEPIKTMAPKGMPQISGLTNPILKSSAGQTEANTKPGLMENLGNFFKNPKAQETLNMAPEAIDAGIKLLGGKEATIQGKGDKILEQGSTMLWKGALQTGNPYAIAGAAVIKGVDYLNRYAGKNTKKQGSLGINTGAYQFQNSVNAGQKTTLFSRGKAKRIDKLTKATDRSNILAGQAAYNSNMNNVLAQSTYSDIVSKNNQLLNGQKATNIISVKKGGNLSPGKLKSISEKAIRKTSKNVIPEGALHARKNNLEELEGQITPKGIPVISYEEGDKIVQHAEIENSEIIFRKEASKKIEEMFKKYKELDEKEKADLEIECGKYLASEIMENTIDNVGLLN